jgi:hypothetical protein
MMPSGLTVETPSGAVLAEIKSNGSGELNDEINATSHPSPLNGPIPLGSQTALKIMRCRWSFAAGPRLLNTSNGFGTGGNADAVESSNKLVAFESVYEPLS